MEKTIPRISAEVATGKISRRRLIQYLALGSTVSGAWMAPCGGAAAEGKGFKAIAYNHISYNVPDYAKSRDFYAALLGMNLAFDDGKQCSLEFGNPVNALYIRKVKPGEQANVDHFAFSIENFDLHAVEAELKRRTLNPRFDGNYAWTVHDPDGFTLQVCAEKGVYPGQAAPGAPTDFVGPAPAQPEGADKAPFRAVAVNQLALHVSDIARSRDFYAGLLGMRVIYYQPDDPHAECFLKFGDNYLYIRRSDQPDKKPYVHHYAFTIANFRTDAVEAELKRRGFDPKPDSKLGWTVIDPDGYTFEVAGKGLPEHIAKDCRGVNTSCPGGVKG
jgi:catechol 2,3-dioxygenase-like lactoylglutathione lyase family enzyme